MSTACFKRSFLNNLLSKKHHNILDWFDKCHLSQQIETGSMHNTKTDCQSAEILVTEYKKRRRFSDLLNNQQKCLFRITVKECVDTNRRRNDQEAVCYWLSNREGRACCGLSTWPKVMTLQQGSGFSVCVWILWPKHLAADWGSYNIFIK